MIATVDSSFRWAPPVLSARSVPRVRVLEQIADRWALPVTTIVAGAGFGKTVVLTQLMQANQLDPQGRDVWLSLQPSDSAASELLGALAYAINPTWTQPRELLAIDVAELIWTEAPTEVSLLVDDTHLVEVGSPGEAALGDLVAHLPANGHIVSSGRRAPNFELVRLRVQNRLVEVGEADLAFDDHETRQLAEQHGNPNVSHDVGGWPALLELANRHGANEPSEFAVEEVIERLDPLDRLHLVAAALLDGASPDLIAKVVANHDGVDVAEPRDISGLPLVAVDRDGSLRPHHLWLDLFVDATPATELDALRRAGAHVLLEQGDPGRAWELLAAAGDFDVGLQALYAAVNHQARPPHTEQLRRWKSLIPDDQSSRAEAIYLDGVLLRETEPWGTEVYEKMDAAVDKFGEEGNFPQQLAATIRATFTSWLMCDTAKLAEQGRLVKSYREAPPSMVAISRLNAFGCADTEGDTILAVGDSSISAADFEPRLAFFAPLYHFSHALNTGELDRAVECADEAAKLAAACEGAGGTLVSAFAPTLRRFVAGSLEPASDQFARLDQYNVGEQLEVLGWLGLMALHSGEIDKARSVLSDLNSPTRPQSGHPRFTSIRAVLRASIALADGDETAARAAIDEVVNDVDTRIGAGWRALAWMPGVPVLLRPDLADMLIERSPGLANHRGLLLSLAINGARLGDRWSATTTPIDDAEAVFASLPLGPALEIACAALHSGDERAHGLVNESVRRWPSRTRYELRNLSDHRSTTISKQAKALLKVVPIPPAQTVRIEVLGSARLFHGDHECVEKDWGRDRVRQLLLHLVNRRRIQRDRLAALLWPDLDDDRAASNLRLTLHYLHGVLEPDRGAGDAPYFLHQSEGQLELAGSDRLRVDAWEFDVLSARADAELRAGRAASAVKTLQELVDLWNGEYLSGLDETADVGIEKADFRQRFVRHGVRLGELRIGNGDHDKAADTAKRVLAVEPWSEAAYRVLISALSNTGERAAALRAIDACRAMLNELEVEPTADTLSLERRIHNAR